MKPENIYLILIFLSVLLFSCSQSKPEKELASLLDKYVEFWNTGNFHEIELVLHPEFELRMSPKYEPEKGIALFKESVAKWRKAYPDFHIELKEKFFTNEQTAAIWEITATNSGEGLHPPTGKFIKVTGMSILHFSKGKIKDEWIASNDVYWMQQLGFEFISPFKAEK